MPMTVKKLIEILDGAAAPDQGINYHNGNPERRYDQFTGVEYMTHDPTHLFLYGRRAQNFYDLINDSKALANELRNLVK